MSNTKAKKSSAGKPHTDPNRVGLKPDHVKMLRERAKSEEERLLQLAHMCLRMQSIEQQYEEQKEAFRNAQKELRQEIQQKRSQILELGQSIQTFYNLEEKQGHRWELNIEEGVWIRVPVK